MKKIKLITFLLFLFDVFSFNASHAQDHFSAFYGGSSVETLNKIRATSDGGYVMVGATYSFGPNAPNYQNAYFIKTSSNGSVQHALTFGDWSHEEATDIRQTSDGGYILSGCTDSYSSHRQAILVKLDSACQITWSKTYSVTGNIQADRIIEKPNGNLVIAGHHDTQSGSNIWIAETDASGNILQSKILFSNANNYMTGIDTTSDGSFLFGGYTINGAGNSKAIFFKTDNQLNDKWFVMGNNSTNNSERAHFIKEISNGDIVIGGGTAANEMNSGVYDFLVAKFDSSGNIMGQKTYGQNGIYETAYDMIYNPVNNTLYLTGTVHDLFQHAFTIAADDQLNMLSTVNPGFGMVNKDYENTSILLKPDGSIVIGGHGNETGSRDFYLALMDSNGATTIDCGARSYGPYTMQTVLMSWYQPAVQPSTPQNVTQSSLIFTSVSGNIYTPKCNTVGVMEKDNTSLEIVTDFASGEIEIIFPPEVENGTVTIYDSYGRNAGTETISKGMHSSRFRIKKSGIYIARINAGNLNFSEKIFFEVRQ